MAQESVQPVCLLVVAASLLDALLDARPSFACVCSAEGADFLQGYVASMTFFEHQPVYDNI
jgi:hypothetical protein